MEHTKLYSDPHKAKEGEALSALVLSRDVLNFCILRTLWQGHEMRNRDGQITGVQYPFHPDAYIRANETQSLAH